MLINRNDLSGCFQYTTERLIRHPASDKSIMEYFTLRYLLWAAALGGLSAVSLPLGSAVRPPLAPPAADHIHITGFRRRGPAGGPDGGTRRSNGFRARRRRRRRPRGRSEKQLFGPSDGLDPWWYPVHVTRQARQLFRRLFAKDVDEHHLFQSNEKEPPESAARRIVEFSPAP